MIKNGNNSPAKEAVGVFDSEHDLEAAVDTLLSNGFNRADLSLLAGEQAVRNKLKRAVYTVEDLEDNPDAPTVAYVSRDAIGDAEGAVIGTPMYVVGLTAGGMVAAAGGPLTIGVLASAIAIGAGAGAALGVALARLIGRHHADYIETQLDHGGLVLWVRTWDAKDEGKATKILQDAGARDVHIHDLDMQPGAITSPEAIRDSKAISNGQKIKFLQRWEYDVRNILVAEEEGMGDTDGALLSRIVNALIALGAPPDTEHSPPTKQGGI